MKSKAAFYLKQSSLMVFLALILIVSFLMVSYLNYQTTRESVIKELTTSSLPLLRENVYSAIHQEIIPPLNIASVMANDSFLISWARKGEKDLAEIKEYLARIRQEYDFFSSFFVSAQSLKYYHYKGILKTLSPDDNHDIWFYDFINSGQKYRLEVDTNEAADNMLTIFINYQIQDKQGKLLGVTGVGIKMKNFAEFLANNQQKYEREIYLVDSQGIVQAHSDIDKIHQGSIYELAGIDKIAEQVLQKNNIPYDVSYKNSRGHSVYLSSRYMPEIQWFLIVEQDETEALSSARFNLLRTLLIGLFTSTVIILLSGVILNHFQKKIKMLAVTDELTKVYNRREMDNHFEKVFFRFQNLQIDYSLIILDLDNFKEINDSKGHLTGDKVLVDITEIIRNIVRKNDLVARFGGDEFVLILECDVKIAKNTAERIRAAVEKHDFNIDNFPVTISLGLAEMQKGDKDIDSLLGRADKALYQAKQQGRNRICQN